MRNERLDLRLPVALAALPGVLSGCNGDGAGDQGFRITSIAFDNDSTITLTFSEPVADLGGVDPNDFRLSVGRTAHLSYTYMGVTQTYMYTSYTDAMNAAVEVGYMYSFTIMSIEPGASANQVVLRSTIPLGPMGCQYLDQLRNGIDLYDMYTGIDVLGFDTAIFLHYAAGDIPVESNSGSVLANIGADWVLDGENYIGRDNQFGFTMLSPQLRIPCPAS